MSVDVLGGNALDYYPCRYAPSKLVFRGPRKDLSQPYVAFLGGTETYGKFIPAPFVSLLEARLGHPCVNFGCLNAGVDVFLRDPMLPETASRAMLTVLQVPCAHNLSNRLYMVHPRRNDRFVTATRMLEAIFPDVDFATFHFTKHMLGHLRRISEDRYWIVEQELRQSWIARMRTLMERIEGPIVLAWISPRAPGDLDRLEVEPMHVTADMVSIVRGRADEYVEVSLSADALRSPLEGMVFDQMEVPAAREMLGPQAHEEIAEALAPVLARLLG